MCNPGRLENAGVPTGEHDGRTLAGYRCGSTVVDVETADADANRWLAEFVSPWAEAVAPGEGLASVRLLFSEPAYQAFESARVASVHRRVACFALDTEVVQRPSWSDAGRRVIADVECGCFYAIRGSHVDIVARPGRRRNRIGLLRVVREILVAAAHASDRIMDVHAAGFTLGQQAVLIVGAKAAGKTTLLAHALSSGRASLLANDRVLIDATREPEEVAGVPTFVSVRADTVRRFPALRQSATERPGILHSDELAADGPCLAEDDAARRVHTLSPAQFAARLGAGHVGHAPLAAVIFPDIGSATGTWAFEPISSVEGSSLLRQSRYGARTGGDRRTIFGELSALTACGTEQEAIAEGLATRTPMFRCWLGPEAYRDGAGAWLRALEQHVADWAPGA